MNSFNCLFCTKIYKNKSTYNQHLKDNHLEKYESYHQKTQILEEITRVKNLEPLKTFECEFCDKLFHSNYSLDRHQDTSCKKNVHIKFRKIKAGLEEILPYLSLEECQELTFILNSNNKIMRDDIDIDIDVDIDIDGDYNTVTKTTNTNSHNTNNINLKINLVNLGEETLDPLCDKNFLQEITDILESETEDGLFNGRPWIKYTIDNMQDAVAKTFEQIHCNKDYPENHNVYAPCKSPHAPYEIFQDNRWQVVTNLDPLKKIALNTKNKITEIMKILNEDNLDETNRQILKRAIFELDRNYHAIRHVEPKMCRKILAAAHNRKDIIKPTYTETKRRLELSKKIRS